MNIFKDEMKKTDIITTLLCLIPFLIGIAVYTSMPEQMPIHFDVNNQPDNYARKEIALFGLPAFLLLIHVICIVVMESDAKRSNTPRLMQILLRFLIPVTALTLADEENWDATHRFAGPVWIVCGVLSLLGVISGSYSTMFVFLFFAVILPVIYSFRLNRKKEK